jgi:hypothetical protein
MDDEERILEGGKILEEGEVLEEGEILEEDEVLEEVEIVDWKKAKSPKMVIRGRGGEGS